MPLLEELACRGNSLGATLYELLTLRPPFEGQTTAELVAQIGYGEPISPRRFDPRIPRDLETILLKALAKRPADRYATASDLADDLERFLHHEPVRARRISPLGRLWRLMRRHPGISAIATAAVTVLAVATVAYVKVVHERDQKGRALEQMEEAHARMKDAMRRTEEAHRATQAAIRTQLLHSATVVRLSNVPNRRERGLSLLKQAATLGPEPALRAQLRNEAVEFLALRDVEARPDFHTGRTRGLVFIPEGNRLATLVLADNGDELTIWDVESRRRLDRHALRAGGDDDPAAPAPGPGGRTGGRRGRGDISFSRRPVNAWRSSAPTARASASSTQPRTSSTT
jgi:eukaryotic-like serine/threonine-protein kinase